MKSASENYLLEHTKHVKLFQIGTSCLSLNGKVEQVIKIIKIILVGLSDRRFYYERKPIIDDFLKQNT